MKKILSVITAISLAMVTMLSALPVGAAEKITADEVKEMICSTGLRAHPELWDKTIEELGVEDDVLKPETRTVKDVIDINNSYDISGPKTIYTKDGHKPCCDENGKYQLVSEQDDNYQYDFYGYDKDGKRVELWGEREGTITYSAGDIAPEMAELFEFREDYDTIAKSINKSDIQDIADIRVIAFGAYGAGIYVRDKAGNEYVIPAETHTDIHAQKLGREVLTLTQGKVMDFKEWVDTVIVFEKNLRDDPLMKFDPYEEYGSGDEIRDTDTRAAYIGTESKFTDVSGDLVSYVNELYELGIINGYDDNTFKPENTITRGETAAMIARMFRYESNYGGEFLDVSTGDWYADDVAALAQNKIINGYDNTSFAPYNSIKYQEVMKILVYALGHGHNGMSYPDRTNETAMRLGLVDGIQSFDTTAPITRGDMAIMLSNALDTHLFTESGGGENEERETSFTVSEEDITLIDYLNGKKLNGKFPPTMD